MPSAAMEMEKRYAHRKELMIYLKVSDTETSEVLGYLADINEQGLLLITKKPIENTKQYILEIEIDFPAAKLNLPDESAPPRPLRFRVHSRWCRKRNSQLYSAGFEFIKRSPRTLASVDEILQRLELNQWLLPEK